MPHFHTGLVYLSYANMLAILPVLLLALSSSVISSPLDLEERATGGYIQNPSGTASFTYYSGCGSPACGIAASSGYTAAISQLAFGSTPGSGAGDACGRCFSLTGQADPYSPSYTGPFHSIVVKTVANPENQYQKPVHFDLCQDTGASNVFFPSGHGALTGTYTEVPCSQWSGHDGSPLWTGACLSGETAPIWPSTGCGNKGTAP
ncbi:endoglucanase V-like protein [Sistotremastrum niveocremeum HHB9708]|uniref:Endoglucanase V-like protein n=1 Tax=Sistotremastrum niveocremeum HHB9708 TaxID=1314777 RepID=A0A164VW22_9AGAM|nr:endoglucanase V-like protein [Sistotremastrum niveocremeum HHB9708]